MEAIEVKHIKGYFKNGKWIKPLTLKIFHDDYPYNVREDDNLTKMWFYHKRYNLGDCDIEKLDSDNYNSWDELEEAIIEMYDNVIIKPVYMYEHGGIMLSLRPFACRWDSNRVGFIFITEEVLKETYNDIYDENGLVKETIIERANIVIEEDISLYNKYLNNECYMYELYDENNEFIDSFGGYYDLEAIYCDFDIPLR